MNTWLAHNYHYTLTRQIWGPAEETMSQSALLFLSWHLQKWTWVLSTLHWLNSCINSVSLNIQTDIVFAVFYLLLGIICLAPLSWSWLTSPREQLTGPGMTMVPFLPPEWCQPGLALGPDGSSDHQPHICPPCVSSHSECPLSPTVQWPKLSSLQLYWRWAALVSTRSLFCVLIWECFCKRFDPTFTVTLLDTWQPLPQPWLCAGCCVSKIWNMNTNSWWSEPAPSLADN